jgi:3-oxo-5-alpha-steroid 4-dehydrogenase 1
MSMAEARLYDVLLYSWFALAAISALSLLFVAAPYGRHARAGWGPTIPSTAGWIVMEAPSAIVMAILWAAGPRRTNPVAVTLAVAWIGHYVYRSFVFPVMRRGGSRPMPAAIPFMACVFNVGNAYLNGRWLFALGPERGTDWFTDPRFGIGALLFAAGFATHVRADWLLARLRAPGETDYKLPRGFLFEHVSCPNYLGEIVEWTGWALAAWSLAGLSFAFWTIANLAPRALAHHRWYREKFADYPPLRRALVPWVI